MADLSTLLGSLPPGANVFDAVQNFLDLQVYPDMGKLFWRQAYALSAVLGLAGVLFILGLCIKAKRGRLSFVTYDGSCTRIDLKFAVPILWTGSIILALSLTAVFKQSLDNKKYTFYTGFAWFMTYLPCSMSYTLLSASVAASAPPLRRYLSRTSYGVIYYNLSVLIFALAAVVGLIIPAVKHADAMVEINASYRMVSNAIQQARANQDPSALVGVANLLPTFDETVKSYYRANRMASAVYSGYLAMYIATGAVPAIILGRTVLKKIARLESKQGGPHTDLNDNNSILSERIAMPVVEQYTYMDDETSSSARPNLPEQPKDRPFAALIEMKTTTFPQRFHDVMQDEDQTSQQRADSLRAILKMDLILVLLYLGLLVLFITGTLFVSLGGLDLLPTKGDFAFGYSFFAWSMAIPSLGLASMLMWDALRTPRPVSPRPKHGDTKSKKGNASQLRSFNAPTASAIVCNQVVNVSYVGGNETPDIREEKKHIYAADLRGI